MFSDSWVEQGGSIFGSNDQIVNVNYSISLQRTLSIATNFTFNVNGGAWYRYIQARYVSGTGFTITAYNTTTPQGTLWYALGYKLST